MILIIAPHSDDHAIAVLSELHRRGERATILDVAELPQRATCSVTFEPGSSMRARIGRAIDRIDLDDVHTVWLRRVGAPRPPELRDRWYAISETTHLLVGLAQALAERRWINPLASMAMDGGWGKVRQLQAALEVGLEIPRTLMTNDPEETAAFVESCGDAGAVFKPFASREGQDASGRISAIFTTEVFRGTDFRNVAHAPCIFQQKVPKRVELRATVMGSVVHTIEIHSQDDAASSIDYRRKYLQVPHAVHVLPRDVEQKLIAWTRALGLVFATGDLIVTPEGRYVALELNQQGQFEWTGRKTGVPIVSMFCDFLTQTTERALPTPRRCG